MSDDLMSLYSRRILALATKIPLTGRLESPQASATRHSPQCGSRVVVDLDLEDGRITRFAQDVQACALGQASAALLGACVMGADLARIRDGRDAMATMLRDETPPAAPWEALEALLPAATFRNRHTSIMLAWEATLAAIEDAMKAAASKG